MINPFNIEKIVRNEDGEALSLIINTNNKLIEHDIEYLTKHTSGISFIDDYVFKFDTPNKYDLKTDLHNQTTREFVKWEEISEDDKKFFSELVFCDMDEKYTIHKRLCLRKKRILSVVETIDKVKSLIAKYDLYDVIADIRNGRIIKHNWEVVNNSPIIFDYAL